MAIDFDFLLLETSQFRLLAGSLKATAIFTQRKYIQDNVENIFHGCCLYIESIEGSDFNVEAESFTSTLIEKSDVQLDFNSWTQKINENSDQFSIDVILDLSSGDTDFRSKIDLLLCELSAVSSPWPDVVVYGVTSNAPDWANAKAIHHLIQGNADSIAHQAMQMFRMRVLAMSPFMLTCCDRGEMPDFFGTPENPSILAEGWWIEGERRFEPKTARDASLLRNACAMMAVPARLLPNGARWLGNALIQRGGEQPGHAAAQDPCPLVHVANGSGLLMEEMPAASERVSVQIACKLDLPWQRLHKESERESGRQCPQ